MIIVVVDRLCPFRSWLTLIFGTKMADVTLDTFHLHSMWRRSVEISQYRVKRRQPTQATSELGCLHREQDRVNLRTPDFEFDGARCWCRRPLLHSMA